MAEHITDETLKGFGASFAKLIERLRAAEAVIAQHDLCHNLHGKVDARAFADGCAAEQRKLYGCAPDADALRAAEQQRDEAVAVLRDRENRIRGVPHWYRCCCNSLPNEPHQDDCRIGKILEAHRG